MSLRLIAAERPHQSQTIPGTSQSDDKRYGHQLQRTIKAGPAGKPAGEQRGSVTTKRTYTAAFAHRTLDAPRVRKSTITLDFKFYYFVLKLEMIVLIFRRRGQERLEQMGKKVPGTTYGTSTSGGSHASNLQPN